MRKRILWFGIALILTLGGLLLPGFLLEQFRNRTVGQVESVPSAYYSAAGLSLARNASAKLDFYEKLQLVSGEWKSERSQAANYEMELEDYEAVEAAREGLAALYASGLYPDDVAANYGNWYTWDATPYKATETTFSTYSAYYWEITLKKYDETKKHTILLFEDGTVFFAYASDTKEIDASALVAVEDAKQLPIEGSVAPLDTQGESVADWVSYAKQEIGEMQWKSAVTITGEEEGQSCHMLQAESDHSYLYALTP
jgi:hypothetical protein